MGLIDLQTNLKSLTYGGNEPYVTKDINHAPSSNQFALEATRRIDDVSRITQMLADKPGIKYLIHNELLTAPTLLYKIADQKNKVNPSSPTSLMQTAKGAGIDTLATIGSTLAQVAVDGTGTHFIKGLGKGGITPYLINADLRTSAYTNGNFTIDITGQTKKSELVTYIGSNETLEIGRNSVSTVYFPYSNSELENGSPELGTQLTGQGSISNNHFDNSNTYLNSPRISSTNPSGSVRKEVRVRLGDQGVGRDTSNAKKQAVAKNEYWFASDDNPMMAIETDKINALPAHAIKYRAGDGTIAEQTLKGGQTVGRDFVKFRFHVITPENEKVLYFRAFLTNFTDNFNGSWNDVNYLGRGETFHTYANFQRKISLSFKIAAATRAELMPIYEKLNYLAGSTAPTYGTDGQFMRGTLSKMTIGDYVADLTGILNSVTYAWNSDYPWEIAMSEPERKGGDELMKELPMVLECSIEFTPIHSFTPKADYNNYISVNINDDMRAAFFNKDYTAGMPSANSDSGIVASDVPMGPQTVAQSNAPFIYNNTP